MCLIKMAYIPEHGVLFPLAHDTLFLRSCQHEPTHAPVTSRFLNWHRGNRAYVGSDDRAPYDEPLRTPHGQSRSAVESVPRLLELKVRTQNELRHTQRQVAS